MKKTPLRMCVGCREMKPKRELLRIVRTPEKKVEWDPTGKKSGRGAYLCSDPGCLKKARKAKSLERTLNIAIAEEIYDELEKQMVQKHDG